MTIALACAGIAATFIAAWFGAYWSNQQATSHLRRQLEGEQTARLQAHLRLLYSEFEFNRKVLWKMNELLGGPEIENLWTGASAASAHLRLNAWDNLVRSGVLSLLPLEHQQVLQAADEATRDVAYILQTVDANWLRVRDWRYWQKTEGQGQLQMPVPVNLIKEQALEEAKQAIDAATNDLAKALAISPDSRT